MPGQFVWHCHIVEHEDNEMMRPFRVGPVQPGQPPDGTMGPMSPVNGASIDGQSSHIFLPDVRQD